jgi:hypothetical protein
MCSYFPIVLGLLLGRVPHTVSKYPLSFMQLFSTSDSQIYLGVNYESP